MMDDDDLPIWSLDDHMAAGHAALVAIAGDAARRGPEPVCHHFGEVDPVDETTGSRHDAYDHLCPVFKAVGLAFSSDRLEGWEQAGPDLHWLETRIPAVYDAACKSGLIYEGWTWEPRDRQPIGAALVRVINNRTI